MDMAYKDSDETKLDTVPSTSPTKPKSPTQYATMNEVLNNQSGFELFIQHCITELSVESILFLIGSFNNCIHFFKVGNDLVLSLMCGHGII